LDQNDPHPFIDHGKIIDKDGRTPVFIGSLAADEKGNIFMSGGWLTKPGDQPTLKLKYKAPEKKTGDQSAGDTKVKYEYETMKRGEFFSWVNINNDLK
jgi:hypothetical protein